MGNTGRLTIAETFGLTPLGRTLKQARMVLRGDPLVPPSRFDTSSLHMLTPRLSVPTWAGRRVLGRRIPLLNLFNRTQTPVEEGWSVRVTQGRDFRGRRLTYDSHNGTDFVVPPGTVTVAAAAGRVASIRQEWNRGGLKIYLDHGGGLWTSHNHLGRALVAVGDPVRCGQPVALTAYSGIDGLVGFPWLAPHVHYNVILGGVLTDPFGEPGEPSLWAARNDPRPASARDRAAAAPPPRAPEPSRIARALESLRDEARRRAFLDIEDPVRRASELIVEATVYPTRFSSPDAGRLLYEAPPPREPRLHLPFRAEDFDGVAFADDLGYRR